MVIHCGITFPAGSTRRTSMPTIAPATGGGLTATLRVKVAYGPISIGPLRCTYVVSDGSARCSGGGEVVVCARAAGASTSAATSTTSNRNIWSGSQHDQVKVRVHPG